MIKFDPSFVADPTKPSYVDYHGRKAAIKNGVPSGIICGYDNNAVCSEHNVAQINIQHNIKVPNEWETSKYKFLFQLVKPGTDTLISVPDDFTFKMAVLDIDTNLRKDPKTTKETVCLDLEQFYLSDDKRSTEVPNFNDHQDDDFAVTTKYVASEKCDGTKEQQAKSCLTDGFCTGNECKTCTGSVTVRSESIGFECDNPHSLEFATEKTECRQCFSPNKCKPPPRQFMGMCVPKVDAQCDKVARDAALALSLQAATSDQQLRANVDAQLKAAENACNTQSNNRCKWGTHETTLKVKIPQGCFVADATPADCRGKNENSCTGNCEWQQGNT